MPDDQPKQHPTDGAPQEQRVADGQIAIAAVIGEMVGRIALLEKNIAKPRKEAWSGWAAVNAWLTVIFIAVAGCSAFLAYSSWQEQVKRRQDEITLNYLDALAKPEFTKALWYLQEFTICFENDNGDLGAGGKHLSYRTIAEIDANRDAYILIAKKWWQQIEHDDHVEDEKLLKKGYCTKRKGIEEDLNLVYSRFEALASCIAVGLCNIERIVRVPPDGKWSCKPFERPRDQLIEVWDHFTLLVVSNYLLLAHESSREWDLTSGNFEKLLKRIEQWAECLMMTQRDEIWKGRRNGPVPEY